MSRSHVLVGGPDPPTEGAVSGCLPCVCGLVVLVHDKGCGFNSRPFHFQETTLGKLFTHMCLCHEAV